MSKEEIQRSTITNFIMKVCSLERYIEIKRQMLCDKDDFEPYVAFQRLARNGQNGISSANVMQFLSENLIDMSLAKCRLILNHYDSDQDGLLSYKEFLELVLPKEHPELRAFVTQRECYDINSEEYLSYETEAAMAVLFALEIDLFDSARTQKEHLDKMELDGHSIVQIIDGNSEGNLNFNNIQEYLNDSGIMAYDSEIINFLRRVDRDDDGVILGEEFVKFLAKFNRENMTPKKSSKKVIELNKAKLECFSPGRKIVTSRISMLADVKEDEGPTDTRQYRKRPESIRGQRRPMEKTPTEAAPKGQEETAKPESNPKQAQPAPANFNQVKPQPAFQKPVQQLPPKDPKRVQVTTGNSNYQRYVQNLPSNVNTLAKNPHMANASSLNPKAAPSLTNNHSVKMKYDTFGQNRSRQMEDANVLKEVSSNTAYNRGLNYELTKSQMQSQNKRDYTLTKMQQKENNVVVVNRVEDYNKKLNYPENIHVSKQQQQNPHHQNLRESAALRNRSLEKKTLKDSYAVQEPRAPELPQRSARRGMENPPPSNRSQLALNRSRERLRRSKYLRGSKNFETGPAPQGPYPVTPQPQGRPVVPSTPNQKVQVPQQGDNQIHDMSPITQNDPNFGKNSLDMERYYNNTGEYRRETIPTSSISANNYMYPAQGQGSMSKSQVSQINENSLDQSQVSVKTKKSKRKRLNSKSRSRKSKSPMNKRKRRSGHSPRRQRKKRMNKVFFNYLADLIFDERNLEECRKQLVSSPDFTIDTVFAMIDKNKIGRFTFEEFRTFLCEIGVSYTDTRSLSDLYACLNSNQNCLLEIEDLASMIAPRDPSFQQFLVKKSENPETGLTDQGTVEILGECFNKLFASRKLLMEAKLAFKEDNIDFHEAFEEIDVNRKGWIGRDDFEVFLRRRLPEFSESAHNEVLHFIENCDFDQDGKVSFKDFYMFFAS